jgi:hypothetical protein
MMDAERPPPVPPRTELNDLYSVNVHSYNSWKYGEEASLYSIAEDSREDRFSELAGSEVPSSRGLGGGGGGGASDAPRPPDTIGGVELCFIEDELPTYPTDLDDSDESFQPYYIYHNPRRCRIIAAAFAIFMVIAGVVLAITLAHVNDDPPRSKVSEGIVQEGDPAVVPDPPTPAPSTLEPTAAPSTLEPTVDNSKAMAANFVYNALVGCPGSVDFTDPSTVQGMLFEMIVDEVHSGAKKEQNGAMTFDQTVGYGIVQETYALGMLYYATVGDKWTTDTNWLEPGVEPCNWYQVNCRNNRIQGQCAVTDLNLGKFLRDRGFLLASLRDRSMLNECVAKSFVEFVYFFLRTTAENNLSGYLPEEFCCMPCLETVTMANNAIGGPILTCLIQIPTLEEIDFVNNVFTGKESAEMQGFPPP